MPPSFLLTRVDIQITIVFHQMISPRSEVYVQKITDLARKFCCQSLRTCPRYHAHLRPIRLLTSDISDLLHHNRQGSNVDGCLSVLGQFYSGINVSR